MTLDGVVYSMTIRYNARIDSWMLSFDGILESIRLVGGAELLGQFHYLDLPPGELRIVDLDGENKEPDRTNFSDRVVLQYTEV